MKIIFISNTIDSYGGGIASVTRNFSQELSCSDDINIEIWVPIKHAKAKIPGVVVRGFSTFHILKVLIANFFCLKTDISDVFYNADVVHRHGVWSIISLLFVYLKNNNKFFSPHGLLMPSVFVGFKKKVMYFLLERNCLLERLIVCSELEKKALLSLANHNHKSIDIVPNAVSDIFFSIEAKDRSFNNNIKKYLYIGAFSRVKNIELLLKSLHDTLLHIDDTNVILDLYGYGEQKYVDELKKISFELGLCKFVQFKPPVYEAELVGTYDSYDYFISTSHSENYGITIAESLVRGTPVITTSNLPWNIISDNNLGFFVEPNVFSVSSALQNSISVDSTTYNLMSKNASLIGSSFKWKHVTKKLLKVYYK